MVKNSDLELNTNQNKIITIKQRLDYYDGMHVYANKPAGDIFLDLEKDVRLNIADTFSRFLFSPAVGNYGSLGKWLYSVDASQVMSYVNQFRTCINTMEGIGVQVPSGAKRV